MGYRLNRIDKSVFMAVSKPLLTEFGIYHKLESRVLFHHPDIRGFIWLTLGIVGQLFQHFGVFEAGISAVDHKNFFPSSPVVIGEVPAPTLALKNFGTPSVIDGVPVSGATQRPGVLTNDIFPS